MKGELLLMILTLLPNKFDRIQLFKPALRGEPTLDRMGAQLVGRWTRRYTTELGDHDFRARASSRSRRR